MAIVNGNTVAKAAKAVKSVVNTVFGRDVVVLDESAEKAPTAPGQIRVLRNYRGFTASAPGRKADLMGQNVVDLEALGLVPVGELSELIAQLTQLRTDLEASDIR